MALTLRDKKEQYLFRETLSSVLLGLLGKCTVIDLRNEAAVYGKISKVSGYMDVELENGIFKNPRGEFFPFDTFYVKSRNIRYVHIPEGNSALQAIEEGLERGKRPKPQPKATTKVFKIKRAQNYQNEIMRELSAQQSTSTSS